MTQDSKFWNETTYYAFLHLPASDFLTAFLTNFCECSNAFVLSVRDYLINTVEHLILACILYLTLCLILYLCETKWGFISFTRGMRKAKRVLFVTAHPDDEAMFFGPTIMHYVQKPNCMVYLMCLSTGKNYGMDKIRKNELYKSCNILGINEENIFVFNHSNLPDSMDVRWPLEIVQNHVLNIVQVYSITNLVTFDRYGVSGHVNHCSIYYSVANLILDGRLPKNCGVFVLESVNTIRKYWLILDLPLSLLLSRFRYMDGFKARKQIQTAMCKHRSQLVWFRRAYMCFSRYMLINTLQQMNLVDIELDLELDD